MRVRSLKARLLLSEAKGPVLGRPSASSHPQYKPRTHGCAARRSCCSAIVLLDDRAARRSCCSAIVLPDEDRKVVDPPRSLASGVAQRTWGSNPGCAVT